jgi:hypothetical protein
LEHGRAQTSNRGWGRREGGTLATSGRGYDRECPLPKGKEVVDLPRKKNSNNAAKEGALEYYFSVKISIW